MASVTSLNTPRLTSHAQSRCSHSVRESDSLISKLRKVRFPDPGSYDLPSQFRSRTNNNQSSIIQSPTYSFGIKRFSVANPREDKARLPPVVEREKFQNLFQKNFISKYQNHEGPRFIPPTKSKFQNDPKAMKRLNKIIRAHRLSPGPGQYSPRTDMSNTGQYFLSNYQSTKVRSFGQTARVEIRKPKVRGALQTPGPGMYQLPSEFGPIQRGQCFSANISPRSGPKSSPRYNHSSMGGSRGKKVKGKAALNTSLPLENVNQKESLMNNLFEINKEGESARLMDDTPVKGSGKAEGEDYGIKSGAMKVVSDEDSENNDDSPKK